MSMTAIATYKGFTEVIDLTENCHTYDEALDTFIYILENDHDVEDVEEADIEITLEGMPDFISDWDDFEGFAPHYFSSRLDDIGIWEAADACGIPFSDVEEAYNGNYDSDEEFVEELLQGMGELDSIPSYVTIDWESTARSVMYDYEEDNGYYFRRF